MTAKDLLELAELISDATETHYEDGCRDGCCINSFTYVNGDKLVVLLREWAELKVD